MVYLRRIAIATLGCCLLGFQGVPETKEPRDAEATQAQVTEQESAREVESFVETKLTASDAAVSDQFGYSVAISGNTAIVGAKDDDAGGSRSGSAYLFDVTTGNQLFKLNASDAAVSDQFGCSVAISGNTAIVGAKNDDAGSAYLFDVTTGNQLFKLTVSDPAAHNRFDYSVGISGNTAIVGAWGIDDQGNIIGWAYLFDVTTGNQLFKLSASDAADHDVLGSSVAISGNRAIVGARSGYDDEGNCTSSAYLFDVTTGNQLFKLTASDAAAGDLFGTSVAISGNTAIVGAYLDNDGGKNSGSAYLFDVTMGHQLFKLTASDATAHDVFGFSVAISGNTAIIGAYLDDDGAYRDDDARGSNSGSAYLFDVTTGNQLFKLTASDAAAHNLFGFSVAISGNTAIIGAKSDDDAGIDSGSAYVFTPEP